MATPTGTITLGGDYIMIEPTSADGIEFISPASIGRVQQKGSEVSDWAVDDIVLYDNRDTLSYKNNDLTWQVINQNNIYFKYVEPPPAP